ncbi:glycosyltransferase [Marinobacter lacisalsi]|uniref:Glycosyltransferase n=1 Tax=Marinobacter lacisalsi TaxID=475979 RepID=A0ABV8QKC0_9GAMM
MKVAVVVRSNIFHGAERRAVKIFSHLLERGHDVELWVSGGLYGHIEKHFPELLPHVVVYDKGSAGMASVEKRSRRGVRRLLAKSALLRRIVYKHRAAGVPELVKCRKVDIAHIFLDFSFPVPSVAGCSTVFEVTSPDIAKHLEAMPEDFIKGHTLFNAVSDSVYDVSRKYVGDHRLTVAPLPYFRPSTLIPSMPRAKDDSITFAARLISRKNGILFAHAVDAFLSRYDNWRVDILGNGPDEEIIKSILSQWIDNDRAFVGKVSDVAPYVIKSKIFVSVIEPDNYPSQSVMEAMYAGNALLLSDTGMSKQKFIDGNGCVVQLTSEAIVEGLETLVSSGNLDALGVRSRQLVTERFSADNYMDYIEGLYRSALTNNADSRRT